MLCKLLTNLQSSENWHGAAYIPYESWMLFSSNLGFWFLNSCRGTKKLSLYVTPVPRASTCRLIWDVVCIWCFSLIKIRLESVALSVSTNLLIGMGKELVFVRTQVTGVKLLETARALDTPDRGDRWSTVSPLLVFFRSPLVQLKVEVFKKCLVTCWRSTDSRILVMQPQQWTSTNGIIFDSIRLIIIFKFNVAFTTQNDLLSDFF